MCRKKIYTDEEILARKHQRNKEWFNTPNGRAFSLLKSYNKNDKKYNRGKGDLTVKWIVENIFSKPCAHCGKEGWNVIGCNRLDNTKPHSKDNVEPCCRKCNAQLHALESSKQIIQINKDNGTIIKIWNNCNECEKQGFKKSGIKSCCYGRIKTYKGFKWRININTPHT